MPCPLCKAFDHDELAGKPYRPPEPKACWQYANDPEFKALVNSLPPAPVQEAVQAVGGVPLLGDTIHAALVTIGITPGRVERWVGNCGCEERKKKLNSLDRWARRVMSGKVSQAKEYLERLMS